MAQSRDFAKLVKQRQAEQQKRKVTKQSTFNKYAQQLGLDPKSVTGIARKKLARQAEISSDRYNKRMRQISGRTDIDTAKQQRLLAERAAKGVDPYGSKRISGSDRDQAERAARQKGATTGRTPQADIRAQMAAEEKRTGARQLGVSAPDQSGHWQRTGRTAFTRRSSDLGITKKKEGGAPTVGPGSTGTPGVTAPTAPGAPSGTYSPQIQASLAKITTEAGRQKAISKLESMGIPKMTAETTGAAEVPSASDQYMAETAYTQPGEETKYPFSTEMTGSEKLIRDQLDPQQKEEVSLAYETAQREGKDAIKAASQKMEEAQRAKERMGEDRGVKQEMDKLTGEQIEIQQSQQIRNSRSNLDKQKQNQAYFGSMGSPGTSAAKIEAVENSLKESEQQFEELQRMQHIANTQRDISLKMDATQYERSLEDLDRQLQDSVDKSIYNALNKLSSAEIEGKIDTPEELAKFTKDVLSAMDQEQADIYSGNLARRSALNDSFKQVIAEANQQIAAQQEYQANKFKPNMEMSEIQGFYVDSNGELMVDQFTGQPIPMPKDPPIKPYVDNETGMLMSFGYDENGNIVANTTQVMEGQRAYKERLMEREFQQKQQFAGQQFQRDIAKMDYKQMLDMQDPMTQITLEKARADLQGKQMDNRKKTVESMGEMINSFGGGSQGAAATAKGLEGTNAGQCGEFVNNIMWGANGQKGPVPNSIQDKEKLITSQTPDVGSMIVMTAGGDAAPYGHVGIVTGVNPDGSIQMTSSNFDKPEQVSTVTLQGNDPRIRGYRASQDMYKEPQVEQLPKVNLSDMKSADRDNLGFAVRLKNTQDEMSEIEDYISNISTTQFVKQERSPRVTQSSEYKKYDDAVREFVNAQLRQESGAAIGQDEYDSAKKEYFPAPGDTPDILATKKQRRDTAVKNMLMKAGIQSFSQVAGYEEYDTPVEPVKKAEEKQPEVGPAAQEQPVQDQTIEQKMQSAVDSYTYGQPEQLEQEQPQAGPTGFQYKSRF